MKEMIWVHGDDISPLSPALKSSPDAPALFVFDEELLTEYQLSFKRLVFMYECLLEMPVLIRRGDPADEILAFAKEHQADKVVTSLSPSPRFEKVVRELRKALEVRILKQDPLVEDRPYDLARFSKYWKQAQFSVRNSTQIVE